MCKGALYSVLVNITQSQVYISLTCFTVH